MTLADRALARDVRWRGNDLEDALLDARGLVPEHNVAWERFHRRLNVRAALPLARLRSGGRASSISGAAGTVLAIVIRRFSNRSP